MLLQEMANDTDISGCCGEIIIDNTDNIILKAQWLEFRLAHSLQKTFESVCGFIPVLPGAFSAYRWNALKENDLIIIDEYLKPFKSPESLDWVDSNIYWLAEDRVMMEKIARLGTYSSLSSSCSGHLLKFISSSKAFTEGQQSVFNLIKQRRRWNNGAWFSLIKSLFKTNNCKEICQTKHTPYRKIVLLLQLWYYFLMISFQWFSIGVYYSAFSMALRVIDYLGDFFKY